MLRSLATRCAVVADRCAAADRSAVVDHSAVVDRDAAVARNVAPRISAILSVMVQAVAQAAIRAAPIEALNVAQLVAPAWQQAARCAARDCFAAGSR